MFNRRVRGGPFSFEFLGSAGQGRGEAFISYGTAHVEWRFRPGLKINRIAFNSAAMESLARDVAGGSPATFHDCCNWAVAILGKTL